MLVQLGNDEVGRDYLNYFAESNVGTTHAKLIDNVETGSIEYLFSNPIF